MAYAERRARKKGVRYRGVYKAADGRYRLARTFSTQERALAVAEEAEATTADIGDLGEEHGHRVLRVSGKDTTIVLVSLPSAVGRAIDRTVGSRARGPILLNTRGARMDRHAATRRLRHLAEAACVQVTTAHPHMLRHTFVTTS
jgi:site-specific recombinase XerD